MRHLLMDPAFPDVVGAWAADQAPRPTPRRCANDNRGDHGQDGDLSDPLLDLFARLEIAATRLW